MEIQTKYFGVVEYTEDEVISFVQGLFGFEQYQKYLIIRFENTEDSLLCLQSIAEPELAFVLVNPFYILPSYSPIPTAQELEELETDLAAPALAFYVICVVREELSEFTMNLKCPIAVNPAKNKAKQLVLENTEYSMRHPFPQTEEGEG